MAYQLAQAYVQIVPSMKGVGKAIENAFDGPSKSTGQKAGQSIGSGLSGGFAAKVGAVAGIASTVFSKVASVVTGSLNSAISRADQMNNFPKVMKNLGYSSEDAAASIKKISSALDGLPTTSSAMTGMVQQLAPLTSNLDQATNIALAFNNAMLAGGASTMEQENALTQYTQMLSAGKVDMQAWRSIQAAMPGQLNQVAEAMLGAGKNSNDLYEAMKNGSISFDDFNKKVMELNQNGFGKYASFAQQAKDATQGIGTAMENVKNRVAKAVQKVVEAVGVENIAGAINGFSSQFGKVGDAAASMVTGVKNWLGQLWQALKDNGALFTFKSLWDGLRDAIMGVVNMVIDWAHMIPPDGLANGIKLVADTLNWFVRHGKELAPIIIGIGTAFAAVKGYQALNSGLQALTGTMNTVTTAAKGVSNGIMLMTDLGGPVAMLKQMAGGLSLVKTAQTAWSTATKMATAVQGAFNAVIAANPIGAIAVAVAAVVAALAWFFTQTEAGRKAWAAFTSWLSETWAALVEGAKAIWNGLGEFLANLWSAISGGITSAWTSITSFLSGVWNGISTTATTIFNGIRDFIVNVFTVIGALIVAPLQAIQNGINTVFGWILSFITQQMNSTNTVWSTVWTAIYNVVSTIFGLISSCISTVVNAIRTVIVVFLSFLKGDWQGAWDAIKSFFTTTWDGIVAFLTPIINGIKTTIGNVLNAIQSVWASIWNAISGVVSTCIQNVRNTISTVLNAISGVWTSVWNRVSSFLGNIWHGITSAVSNGIQSVSNTVGRIKSTVLGAVSGAGRWLYDTGRQVIQGLINGIGGAFKWVKDTIGNLGKNLIGWAKGVLGIHSPSRIFRDEVGKWIPAGMAQGIDKASGLVADSIDGLTDMVPTVSLKTDASRLETPLAYSAVVGNGRIAYTVDDHTAEYATKQDIIDAIDQALTAGITLNLSDRGGEVMAGKLAKPMSYELNSLAMRGR